MNGSRQQTVGSADEATQGGEAQRDFAWAEASVWTERMLSALGNGVKGGKWFSLMDKVFAPQTLAAAWTKVRANKGAAGVDGQSIERFVAKAEGYLAELSAALREGSRPGGKIDPPGAKGMGSHLSEQKRPVGAAQRSHREAVLDRFARKAEFFPREEISIVGLEIDALHRQRPVEAGFDRAPARLKKQHPPIEEQRLGLPQSRPVRSDTRRLTFGEGPARGLEHEVELADLEEVYRRAQTSSEPPTVAAASAPALIVRPRVVTLGWYISKPRSIMRVCSPWFGRSKV